MKAIPIGKNYKIITDGYNVIISERKVHQKTRKSYWTHKWFYPSFEAALQGIIDRDIISPEIEDIVSRIKELKEYITEALQDTDKINKSGRPNLIPKKVQCPKCHKKFYKGELK